jgi:hypothetical protein
MSASLVARERVFLFFQDSPSFPELADKSSKAWALRNLQTGQELVSVVI